MSTASNGPLSRPSKTCACTRETSAKYSRAEDGSLKPPGTSRRCIDGTIHDTFRPDPFRCIYGAWQLIRDAGKNEPSCRIEAGLVDLEQVFLPYAQDATGRTFYELMRERRFQPLLPGSKNSER
jgi:hypothetical protein